MNERTAAQPLPGLLLVMLSIIGIADAGYITYEELQGVVPPCGAGFDCGAVLQSPYAHIGPVPLAALGLVFYIVILVLAVLHVTEFKLAAWLPRWRWLAGITALDLLAVLSGAGLLFSAYLVTLMAVVIEAWCKYCLISAGTSTLIFLTTQYAMHTKGYSSTFLKGLLYPVIGFLYRNILKPVLFLLDPEHVHNGMTKFGAQTTSFAAGRGAVAAKLGFHHPDLERQIFGLTFPSPLGLSAGFDYNGDLCDALPALGFGWHTIGTVTLQPYAGNAKPRLGRYPRSQALLVNKGLKSIGTRAMIQKLAGRTFKIPTAVSIASTNTSFTSLKEQLLDICISFWLFENSSVRHHLYELNISCPNTFGGEPFTTPARLEILLKLMDQLELTRPLLLKMPIDQSEAETRELLAVIRRHTVAGVIFGNLTKDKKNPALHPEEAKLWQTQKGKVSGRPTFERSTALARLARKVLPAEIVVIGTGGIFSYSDLQEKQRAGAELFQLITGMIYQGPQLIGQLNRELVLEKQATK